MGGCVVQKWLSVNFRLCARAVFETHGYEEGVVCARVCYVNRNAYMSLNN